jgi:hypothetical protein
MFKNYKSITLSTSDLTGFECKDNSIFKTNKIASDGTAGHYLTGV